MRNVEKHTPCRPHPDRRLPCGRTALRRADYPAVA